MSLERFIKYIREGEPVSPGTPNRPLQQLDQNIQYLWNLIQAANLGSTVYARAQTVNSTLKVGQPVYFDATSARFEPAFAATESDSATGYLTVPDQAQVWGIVAEKHNATLADILLFGYAQIDIREAVGADVLPDGSVAAGTWYLSGASSGRLTRQLPPVTIPVLKTNGSGGVYVNPSFVDFLENHRHYMFSLVMAPAGTVATPATGAVHAISAANAALPGWLPAGHAIFGGLAPANAKFGYNLSQDSALRNLYPPVPVQSACIQMQRPSIQDTTTTRKWYGQQLMEDLVVIDRNGIWWMRDCYDEVPWPTDLASVTAASGDGTTITYTAANTFTVGHIVSVTGLTITSGATLNIANMTIASRTASQFTVTNTTVGVSSGIGSVTGAPLACTATSYVLKLYYTRVGFATDNTTVSSLRSVDNRLVITCTGQTTSASTGNLDIDLDLNFLNGPQTATGHIAIKTFNAATSTFTAGPIAEGVYAKTDNVLLSSTVPTTTIVAANTSYTVHHGPVGIGVLTSSRELISQLVRLDGVTEENYPVLYLGMPNSSTTSYIVKFEVPADVPNSSQLRFRSRILGRASGNLPQLTVSYYKTERPINGLATPIAVTQTYVALTMVTVATLTSANQAVEALSSEIPVAPGDLVYIKVQRSPASVSDQYPGELGVMQQVGVLTSS